MVGMLIETVPPPVAGVAGAGSRAGTDAGGGTVRRSVDPAARQREIEALEGRVAELSGLINAAHGELVGLIGEALDHGSWEGWGLHSPGHWLAWRTGMGLRRAHDIVRLAERRAALPECIQALEAGELSLDQAVLLARHVPDGYGHAATDLARVTTVSQLQRTLPRYGWEPLPAPVVEAEDGAEGPDSSGEAEEGDDAASAGDAAAGDEAPPAAASTSLVLPEPPVEERVSHGTDEREWWLSARLELDRGAVVDQAFRAIREDLYRQACVGLPEGAPRPRITTADVLVAMAEMALAGGQARLPGSDRYRVLVHLEHDPGSLSSGPAGAPRSVNEAALHLGPVLPDSLRRLVMCDGWLRPVHEQDTVPVGVGRITRVVSRRLRRLVEHRDGGCVVPGCHRTTGLEIHHIWHWEDGGPTETHNLLTLCGKHHRDHHQAILGIEGNADRRDGITFRDRWGRELAPAGPAHPPDLTQGLAAAAERDGVVGETYTCGAGEPLDATAVFLQPDSITLRPGQVSSSSTRQPGAP
jgi:hypothetical protein